MIGVIGVETGFRNLETDGMLEVYSFVFNVDVLAVGGWNRVLRERWSRM